MGDFLEGKILLATNPIAPSGDLWTVAAAGPLTDYVLMLAHEYGVCEASPSAIHRLKEPGLYVWEGRLLPASAENECDDWQGSYRLPNAGEAEEIVAATRAFYEKVKESLTDDD